VTVYAIDPLRDARWAGFVDSHPSASVFHSEPWLRAIQQTYGYKPIVFTTSAADGALTNGIVFCQIDSWLTGRRLVSLPFSDHCEPLIDNPGSAFEIAQKLRSRLSAGRLKYIELRPTGEYSHLEGIASEPACWLHFLDLTPAPDEILRNTHKTAIQQPIKRAEREGIKEESGYSDRLLSAFYSLLLLTRRRHQLPPQPIEWFRNLAAAMGERLRIRVAYKDEAPIASILTMTHGDTLVYKYAASDTRFNNLGGTSFLLWKAIAEAKQAGLTRMDFGRSDADNQGLISFKDRWGTKSSKLIYLRWSKKQGGAGIAHGRSAGVMKKIFSSVPDSLLQATGRILYRHIG
jgi:CelD/BcsL family acetyltransferase involved in cellulose biosynthesis